MSALAPLATPNPQTDPGVQSQLTGTPISGDVSGAATYVPPPAAPPPIWNYNPPAGQQLQGNGPLALPGAPSFGAALAMPSSGVTGPAADATYLAQEAMLRHQIQTQYADLLQQLGYSDPASGQFIPGSIEVGANMRRQQLQRQLDLEQQGVTQDAQRNGILFSGMRGTLQAQAQEPTEGDIGQLEYQTPQDLANAYNKAMDLSNQYNEQNAMLIADAATRATGGIDQNPPYTPPATDASTSSNYSGTAPSTTNSFVGGGGPGVNVSGGGVVPLNPITTPRLLAAASQGTPLTSTSTYTGGGGGRAMPALGGAEVTEPTTVHMGEISSPGDRMSHEVVIPRYRLTPKQNKTLDKLMDAAGIASAARGRLAA